jgi:tocopherol cyclase
MSRTLLVVTGASRGLGRCIAEAFFEESASEEQPAHNVVHCCLVARNLQGLNDTAAVLRSLQPSTDVTVHEIDLGDLGHLEDLLEAMLTALSPSVGEFDKLILINNAGSLGEIGPMDTAKASLKDCQQAINLNITSVLWTTRVVGQWALRHKLSSIAMVNISSLLAVQAFPTLSLYAAGKAARDMYYDCLSQEEWVKQNSGIRLLNYAPGPLETDMVQEIRTASTLDTSLKPAFARKLVEPLHSARVLVRLLQRDDYSNGAHIDYYDVASRSTYQKVVHRALPKTRWFLLLLLGWLVGGGVEAWTLRKPFTKKVSSSWQDPGTVAYPEQSPHAGCHFRPTHPFTPRRHPGRRHRKRFFEGWYYRITIPEQNASLAFIYSIEDPFEDSALSLACHQIMGPDEDYLVQADKDHSKFWAWYHQPAFGCVFAPKNKRNANNSLSSPVVDVDQFDDLVTTGFQVLPNRLQGRLVGHDGSQSLWDGNKGVCTYDMTISPISGWGDKEVGPKSTAGWLASYRVFEPHWQVFLADARATGTLTWKNTTYTFQDAPLYAEKNWGGAFPIKWYWCQCNSFDGYITNGESLSVTAGGGTRKIPFGQKESLGMVSVHYKGKFYEATPWLGDMSWEISPWGYWSMKGRSTKGARPFEVEICVTCDSPGVKLRAPTETDGMAYFCRDSFLGNVSLSLWELKWDTEKGKYVRETALIDHAVSTQGAVGKVINESEGIE